MLYPEFVRSLENPVKYLNLNVKILRPGGSWKQFRKIWKSCWKLGCSSAVILPRNICGMASDADKA